MEQNIASWVGPEAANDSDSERLHLYKRRTLRTRVFNEMLRGHNCIITVKQLAISINKTPTGAEARNNACRSDTFVSGVLMS